MNKLLIDLDGVLYVSDKVIEGAADTLEWLTGNKIPHLFLTNTSSRPRNALVDKLAGFGIHIDENSILTPPVAAVHWLKKNCTGKTALFVPKATQIEFSQLSLASATDVGDITAVVIGDLGEAWNFATLNQAFRILMHNPDCRLIALGMTRYWQAADGLRLDVAPFVKALEHATGKQALVMGKPAKDFFNTALEMLDTTAEQTAMIGDDIYGDINGAQQSGIRGILVKTGKFRDSDLASDVKPYAVLSSISDLPEWWRKNR